MTKFILPYKTASKSANDLAEALDWPVIGKDVNLVRVKPSYTIVNWGKGVIDPMYSGCRVINKPEAICRAVNKLSCFTQLKARNVPTVEWTTSRTEAAAWLASRTKVCARTEVEGRDGSGLTLVGPTDGWTAPVLPIAPLYTKFVNARAEYRINVCNDRTVGVQLKVPTRDNANPDIKTGGNGYGFRLLAESEIPHGIRPVARDAIRALGLDFGGVDLINTTDGRVLVLEVNTAPELTPAMVTAYANSLRSI